MGGQILTRADQLARFDSAYVRRLIDDRSLRARFFGAELFAEPAWDMLLDLAAAHAEGRQVSISSLCHASGVPATTALRWIMTLEEAGLVQREADHADRRRSFVALTAKAADCMARYLTTIGGKRTR